MTSEPHLQKQLRYSSNHQTMTLNFSDELHVKGYIFFWVENQLTDTCQLCLISSVLLNQAINCLKHWYRSKFYDQQIFTNNNQSIYKWRINLQSSHIRSPAQQSLSAESEYDSGVQCSTCCCLSYTDVTYSSKIFNNMRQYRL